MTAPAPFISAELKTVLRADALLAQPAIDRLQSAAYELVLDGKSYRRRQKSGVDIGTTNPSPRRRRTTK